MIDFEHRRKSFKDLDGAFHGRLDPNDENMQNRIFKLVFMLMRCGRHDEVHIFLFSIKFSLRKLMP